MQSTYASTCNKTERHLQLLGLQLIWFDQILCLVTGSGYGGRHLRGVRVDDGPVRRRGRQESHAARRQRTREHGPRLHGEAGTSTKI